MDRAIEAAVAATRAAMEDQRRVEVRYTVCAVRAAPAYVGARGMLLLHLRGGVFKLHQSLPVSSFQSPVSLTRPSMNTIVLVVSHVWATNACHPSMRGSACMNNADRADPRGCVCGIWHSH